MDIASNGLVDNVPNIGKLPPDKYNVESNNIIGDLMQQSGISTMLETEDNEMMNDCDTDENFQEVSSKRTKRKVNGEKVTPSQVRSLANVDISNFGSTAISQNRYALLGNLNIEINETPSTSKQQLRTQKTSGML